MFSNTGTQRQTIWENIKCHKNEKAKEQYERKTKAEDGRGHGQEKEGPGLHQLY